MDVFTAWDNVTVTCLHKGGYALPLSHTVEVCIMVFQQGRWSLPFLVKARLQKVDHSCLLQEVVVVHVVDMGLQAPAVQGCNPDSVVL